MTQEQFNQLTEDIGHWFANLKLNSFRKTFQGDVYPSSALVSGYELFVEQLRNKYVKEDKPMKANKKYRIVKIERPHEGIIYKVQKRLFGSWGWWTIIFYNGRPAIFNTEGDAKLFIEIDMQCPKTKKEVIYDSSGNP